MKRLFDIVLGLVLIVVFSPLMLLIAIIIKLSSKGPVLFWSKRVGRNSVLFTMPKFRTMHIDTPNVATHLLKESSSYITWIGSFLRKSSLDELPQLWSILCGKMSFIGPRPALFNQDDLISLRKQEGVDQLYPGLTGWAQINGRDELSIPEKVELDKYYLRNKSFFLDLKILFITFFIIFDKQGIAH